MRTLLAVILSLVAFGLAGCYSYINNRVTVIDGETLVAIRGALVEVGYSGWPMGTLYGPSPSIGVTDERGTALLRVTANKKWGVFPSWHTEPQGYFRGPDNGKQTWGACDAIDGILHGKSGGDAVDLTLRIWARPAPGVLVTVPTGYRGYVRVCRPRESPPGPETSKRLFECTVDAQGRCELPAASILQHALLRHEFQFADGTSIPVGEVPAAHGNRLAAWPLWYEGDTQCSCNVFVICSESQAAFERETLWPKGVPENGTMPAWLERVRRGPFPPGEILR